MKSRESALRLMRFEAEAKARKVADLEMMIRDLTRMETDLDRQIKTEEERSGIKDPGHYAYSTFAKAAAQRKENVKNSLNDLKAKYDMAIIEHDEAADDLQKSEAADARDANRGRNNPKRGPVVTVASASSEH